MTDPILCPEHAEAYKQSINIIEEFRDFMFKNPNKKKKLIPCPLTTTQTLHIKNNEEVKVNNAPANH